ncbi:LacI family DNA-binding transcriptional regulator [Rhizobium leguminosarum]|uniref:LacI family DNA-binding transcriptional regulator n=1 Tax=Rhizobium leguminosarum TaxID=384 RepID=UPI000487F6D4|nr:LacI family DNA-binding transcriptional regulator [Rhizobium leguminosarum]
MKQHWKGPTVVEIADFASVGKATVDRVLHGRDGVAPATRKKVLEALAQLESRELEPRKTHIGIVSQGGVAFNGMLKAALGIYLDKHDDVVAELELMQVAGDSPVTIAQAIERQARYADGLLVASREHPTVARAVRNVSNKGIPVVCFTTDLPNSSRCAYVGNDQWSAGAIAANFIGRMLRGREGNVLCVGSAPFWSQQLREAAFRKVLAEESPLLRIDKKFDSRCDSVFVHRSISEYLAQNAPPLAIYNVSGGNAGIAKALVDHGIEDDVVFIGHETETAPELLTAGVIDLVISHDFYEEIADAINIVMTRIAGGQSPQEIFTRSIIYSKHSKVF